jgi:ankyrin repeat protein
MHWVRPEGRRELPIQTALRLRNFEDAHEIIRKRENLEATDDNGETALHSASAYSHDDVVNMLLNAGVNPNPVNNRGERPIHIVCALAMTPTNIRILYLLLTADADPNAITPDGKSPLGISVFWGIFEYVRLLLDNGAKVNMKNSEGDTFLHTAALGDHVKVASILLDRGANPNDVNEAGDSPLHIAAREGHEEFTALLLEKGAETGLQNKYGETAIHVAARNGNSETVSLIVQKDPSQLDAVSIYGNTALHYASYYGNEITCKTLIFFRADPRISNNDDETAHQISKNDHIYQMLIKYWRGTRSRVSTSKRSPSDVVHPEEQDVSTLSSSSSTGGDTPSSSTARN